MVFISLSLQSLNNNSEYRKLAITGKRIANLMEQKPQCFCSLVVTPNREIFPIKPRVGAGNYPLQAANDDGNLV
jgi:hypothetical protein